MACFYKATVSTFLGESPERVLVKLSTAYAEYGYVRQFTDQTLTWEHDVASLRSELAKCFHEMPAAADWGVMLEFTIPRKELRIDAVLLVGDSIVLLEAKTFDTGRSSERQIEEYALLLHYFHKTSDQKRIVPIIVSASEQEADVMRLAQRELFPQLARYWIAPPVRTSWEQLHKALLFVQQSTGSQIGLDLWDQSEYFPVPSILEAATALRSGLSIREIAHSEASEHEIVAVRDAIQGYIDLARANSSHTICFLTGVPGSGKTLVGLSLAHSKENETSAVNFMSGNGPLVKVLQHLFTQESRKSGASAAQAKVEAKTLIENVHVFARYYAEENQGKPSNQAIIFDEAQRAWNRDQNFKKFKRDYSEPEMLLRIMERQDDWAVVIALVGGGQEINDGEAGLEEWGAALSSATRTRRWGICASPEVIHGGASTAGHRLFANQENAHIVNTNDVLHLRTSNRSLRAEKLAQWVNLVLEGDAESAKRINVTERFPIFLTRDLKIAKTKLHQEGIGTNRYGLVGSSGAARLRAEGLEPNSSFHADYKWEYWYLGERTDVRSSYKCEVFATEFEIQGLELDWIGLCWGGDMVWSGQQWLARSLRPGPITKWNPIRNAEKRVFRFNSYRVLLTRARQGMVLFIPAGDADDPTNIQTEFDRTADFLVRCGVIAIDAPRHA